MRKKLYWTICLFLLVTLMWFINLTSTHLPEQNLPFLPKDLTRNSAKNVHKYGIKVSAANTQNGVHKITVENPSDNRNDNVSYSGGVKRHEKSEEINHVKINDVVNSSVKEGGTLQPVRATDILQRDAEHPVKEVNPGGQREEHIKYPEFVSSQSSDGPGEFGNPVIIDKKLLSDEEKRRLDEGWERNSFNQLVSDRISVKRRVVDIRTPGCKAKQYRSSLPAVSVIVCFHNEAWSVLLRSVHSVIDRSPPHLLKEVILVDDFSTMEHLKKPLDTYMASLKKVRIVRAAKREGLIRARLLGYSASSAPALVFLDSHIECFPGWLEPLLNRIAENPKAVPFPMIEGISSDSFSLPRHPRISHAIGIFSWNWLDFSWSQTADPIESDEDPVRSPTMPGGLFAISNAYFTTIGTYDSEMNHWGGENMELSFKVWMCDGSVELIPCSHVGHVYRKTSPIKWAGGSQLVSNSIRVAEVWMDEYKKYFYERLNYRLDRYPYGDVTERKRLRESLHCKSFDWYMRNIAKGIFVPRDAFITGEIRSAAAPLCLDVNVQRRELLFQVCHGYGNNQIWHVMKNGDIRNLAMFLCYTTIGNRRVVVISQCQQRAWSYNKNQSLTHVQSGLCLQATPENKTVTVSPCNGGRRQKWIINDLAHDTIKK